MFGKPVYIRRSTRRNQGVQADARRLAQITQVITRRLCSSVYYSSAAIASGVVCRIWRLCKSQTKALAKRTRKSTQVLDLHSTCVSFGHPLASTCIDLRRLAWTCVDFGRAQIWTQVDASFLPFGHPVQVDTSWLQVICCYKNALTSDMREIYSFLRLASRLATLRKSVRKF